MGIFGNPFKSRASKAPGDARDALVSLDSLDLRWTRSGSDQRVYSQKAPMLLELPETPPSGEAAPAQEELQQMQRSIGAASLPAQLLHHRLEPLSCRWSQRWTTMAQNKRLFSTSVQRLWPCKASESEIAPDDPTSTRAAPDIVQPAAATQRRTWTRIQGFGLVPKEIQTLLFVAASAELEKKRSLTRQNGDKFLPTDVRTVT